MKKERISELIELRKQIMLDVEKRYNKDIKSRIELAYIFGMKRETAQRKLGKKK
jgi:hypothetical protein